MFLLYADDVVFFANTLGDEKKLMKALEKICMHTNQVSIALKQRLCL